VDRVEEVPDVELQVPAAALAALDFPHEDLQALDGRMRALAAAVGVHVVDEGRLVEPLELWNDPVMNDPIGEVRRMDLARFRARRDETRRRPRLPGAGIQAAL
jgi:hypothetical protein